MYLRYSFALNEDTWSTKKIQYLLNKIVRTASQLRNFFYNTNERHKIMYSKLLTSLLVTAASMNIYAAVETDSTDEKKDENAERGIYLSYDDKKPDGDKGDEKVDHIFLVAEHHENAEDHDHKEMMADDAEKTEDKEKSVEGDTKAKPYGQ